MHYKEQLSQMHSEHYEWQNRINFYKNEIKQLDQRLGQTLGKQPKPELLAEAEHFQNQFIIQKEVLDIMRHDFKQHENEIEALQKTAVDTNTNITDTHQDQRQRLEEFEKIFHDLQSDFVGFIDKTATLAF